MLNSGIGDDSIRARDILQGNDKLSKCKYQYTTGGFWIVNGPIFLTDHFMEHIFETENFDDWLCEPYHLKGVTEYLGEKTHGLILDMPLNSKFSINKIKIETIANEVIIGILGLTILRDSVKEVSDA